MGVDDYQAMAESVIDDSQALALSTTDGSEPWVAPVEDFRDEAGNFAFFSTTDSRHAQRIEANDTVAAAIWEQGNQPEYSPDLDATIKGVQIRGSATRLSEEEFPRWPQLRPRNSTFRCRPTPHFKSKRSASTCRSLEMTSTNTSKLTGIEPA